MNNNKKIKLIVDSFLTFILEGDWDILNYGTLKHLVKNCNIDILKDTIISDNKDIYENIVWSRVGRVKLLRLISRNPAIIDQIEIDKYKFTIEEAKYFLRLRPDMLETLKIDLNTISKKDAHILLTLGMPEFSTKIDIGKYYFTSKENYEILEKNLFKEYIFNSLKLNNLKDYHIADIIKHTGELYIHQLAIKKLTTKKWCEILDVQPSLLSFCNLEKFKEGDIFNTAKLVSLFQEPNLSYLIKEREDYKEELSALGWEKLIIAKPDEFIDECNFEKLNDNNWREILLYHPSLRAYKD